MIQSVGYTDEGSVFTKMVLEINEQPTLVTMHMTQNNAKKFAGDLLDAADKAQGAKNDERDSQNTDKISAA